MLPDWVNPNRRLVRAPVNPNDISTVVSIIPKRIKEDKWTIHPGQFILEPGSYDKPTTLVVGSSCWWREVSEDQPLLEIPCYSTQVAESIVKDYCGSYLLASGEDVKPGLFWVPGSVTPDEVKLKYKVLLNKTKDAQIRWYHALIKMADSIWVRGNNNPSVIGEDMRIAARELGIAEKKDWMSNARAQEMDRCKACGSLVDTQFPVCPVCKAVVNETLAKERNIKFAV